MRSAGRESRNGVLTRPRWSSDGSWDRDSGHRAFKLRFGITTGYGRYAKPLRGPAAGRYIIAWKLRPTMGAMDVTETLDEALAITAVDRVKVRHRRGC
jgi:hypothetical protein